MCQNQLPSLSHPCCHDQLAYTGPRSCQPIWLVASFCYLHGSVIVGPSLSAFRCQPPIPPPSFGSTPLLYSSAPSSWTQWRNKEKSCFWAVHCSICRCCWPLPLQCRYPLPRIKTNASSHGVFFFVVLLQLLAPRSAHPRHVTGFARIHSIRIQTMLHTGIQVTSSLARPAPDITKPLAKCTRMVRVQHGGCAHFSVPPTG